MKTLSLDNDVKPLIQELLRIAYIELQFGDAPPLTLSAVARYSGDRLRFTFTPYSEQLPKEIIQ